MSASVFPRILLTVAFSMGLLALPAQASTPPGAISEYAIPAGSEAAGIAAGPDGNLWFTENDRHMIGRITPTGTLTEFPLANVPEPLQIAAGPDGNMWFTENKGDAIGRITMSGVVTEYALAPGRGPDDITAGPDGNLWFTEYNGNRIGKITPTGVITEYPLPDPWLLPGGITAGPDGNLWFTANNLIARVTPTGDFTGFPLTGVGDVPFSIAAGPDGNLWFTEYTGDRIARITPAGVITEIDLENAGPDYPYGIATGPEGNLWFAASGTNAIGRITPDGTMTQFPIPTPNSTPYGIAAGPDGSLWFSEFTGDKIGRITSGVSATDRKPALNGTGQVGLPLVCGADVWGPKSSVTISWQRSGSPLGGQTGLAYTPLPGDLGTVITCSSTAHLPGMLTTLSATSNAVTVVAQLTGPPGATGETGPQGPPGQPGQNGIAVLAAVWAPGSTTVQAGKTLKVQFGVTNAAQLTAQLKGKRTLTKQIQAKAGTNTLRWKLPKNLKAGKYTLRLLYQGTSRAKTTVKVTR